MKAERQEGEHEFDLAALHVSRRGAVSGRHRSGSLYLGSTDLWRGTWWKTAAPTCISWMATRKRSAPPAGVMTSAISTALLLFWYRLVWRRERTRDGKSVSNTIGYRSSQCRTAIRRHEQDEQA